MKPLALAFVLLVLPLGCGKNDDSEKTAAGKTTTAPAPAPEPIKPAAATTAESPADLLKVATDPAQPVPARTAAAKALGERKDAASGKPLFEAAKIEKDDALRGELFEAAGRSGSDEVFTAATAFLLSEGAWEMAADVERAIVPFGRKAFDWAVADLPNHRLDRYEITVAEVIAATAQPGDEAKLKQLSASVNDGRTANRLAARGVELGDTSQIAIVIKSLEKSDHASRADAALVLTRLADKIPADQKARVLELATKAKAEESEALSAYANGPKLMAQYDDLIAKLGGK